MKRKQRDPAQVDLSKVDISNDFRDFSQMYSKPEDIEAFIIKKNAPVPVLSNLLKLRKEGKIGLTPTELNFSFDSMFDYIYDIYRVPVPETDKKMLGRLKYIEGELIYNGFKHFIGEAYENAVRNYDTRLALEKMLASSKIKRAKTPLINYYINIEGIEHPDFYISKKPSIIESFWIKSSTWAGQPVAVGDEAYMRVHVYPERVYIFGCDDSSYTLYVASEQEAKDFAMLLKCAAPVWNFCYRKTIHHKLEFTN